MPQKTKNKIIESLKGNQYTKGKYWKVKDTTKYKQRALKQFKNGMPEKTKEKIRKTLKEKYKDDAYKNRITKKIKEAFQRPEVIKKMSDAQKGNTNGFQKGNKLSVGEKNGRWLGGISYEPYSSDWSERLRRSIRERDNYTCQVSGERQGDRTFPVHHIDYDKKNNDPSNLITLSLKIHPKTNSNRKNWTEYFQTRTKKV